MTTHHLPNGLRQHYADASNGERFRIDGIARSVRRARRRLHATRNRLATCEAEHVNGLMRRLDDIRRDAERITEPYPDLIELLGPPV
jgi:hypothetical protein